MGRQEKDEGLDYYFSGKEFARNSKFCNMHFSGITSHLLEWVND